MPTLQPILMRLLEDGFREPGIVAVSGGADSVALLLMLSRGEPTLQLHVAHFNHGLRGEESDGDEVFVRDFANSLGIPFHVERAILGLEADAGKENLEDLARRRRYDFFTRLAGQLGASWIATGHTQDDRAETVLHRLIRGTGLQGLRAIAVCRELTPGLKLIRPILDMRRKEIVQYLAENGQRFRVDSSNYDPRYTRNRIRHELIPLLRTFNPNFAQSLSQLAEQAEESFAAEEDRGRELLQRVELPQAGSLCILDASKLVDVSPSQIREMFRYLWQRQGWPRRSLTREHWARMSEVAQGTITAVDLPDGLRIRRKGSVVQVGPREG